MLRPARLCAPLLTLGLTLGASAQGASVVRDIAYHTDITGTYRADLYQPPTPGIHPGIVMIHGGSWRSGNKTELRRLSRDLAEAGYACLSIDYDTHSHSFPVSWQESRGAVGFFRTHAAEYHVDPDRIAVLGTSAGGELAALVALAPQGPLLPVPSAAARAAVLSASFAPDQNASADDPASVHVAAAVLFNGIYDLHPRAYLLRRYLGAACDRIPGVCSDASPDNHIHPDAPPIFVGHGTHDRLIPYSQATTFVSLLQSAGDRVTPFVATGAGHSYWRDRHWYQENLNATEAFLARTMPER